MKNFKYKQMLWIPPNKYTKNLWKNNRKSIYEKHI